MFETQRPKDTKESATDQDNQLSYQIIGTAIEVHPTLGGPGLLESIYKGAIIRDPLFLDLLVEDRLIIEVKATEKDLPIHDVQLLTYLRLTGLRLGLVINFGHRHVKEGIRRVFN